MKKSADTILDEVGYKGYYHEYSEWYAEYVEAVDVRHALREFALRHGMGNVLVENTDKWRWEEGDWLMSFRYVKAADTKPCPFCNGTGKIHAEL